MRYQIYTFILSSTKIFYKQKQLVFASFNFCSILNKKNSSNLGKLYNLNLLSTALCKAAGYLSVPCANFTYIFAAFDTILHKSTNIRKFFLLHCKNKIICDIFNLPKEFFRIRAAIRAARFYKAAVNCLCYGLFLSYMDLFRF